MSAAPGASAWFDKMGNVSKRPCVNDDCVLLSCEAPPGPKHEIEWGCSALARGATNTALRLPNSPEHL